MRNEDLKALRMLVDEYGTHSVLENLSSVLKDYADQMSDWNLKDKAAESSAAADMLESYVSNSGV
ncbi:MAG TPA: hypothetical protein VII94_00610 [Candidatus Saccharimonadales bacterium]